MLFASWNSQLFDRINKVLYRLNSVNIPKMAILSHDRVQATKYSNEMRQV